VFYAYKDWMDTDGMEVLHELSNQPGLHSYPFVEIPLNTYLYHLDIAPADDESRSQRFIFDMPESVFEFLAAEEIKDFRIYIQTRREEADYQLKRIIEISKGYAISGESVHIFSCADGSIEISGFSDLDENDVVRISSLWKEPRIDR